MNYILFRVTNKASKNLAEIQYFHVLMPFLIQANVGTKYQVRFLVEEGDLL